MTPDPLFKIDKLSITSALIGFVGMFGFMSLTQDPAGAGSVPTAVYPATNEIALTGIVRDFREHSAPEGHPDFERLPDLGWGHFIMNVAPRLGEDGTPVFVGGGRQVTEQWTDDHGQPICWCVPREGHDVKGRAGASGAGGVQSSATFADWFRDMPGVNLSEPLTLTLQRQEDGVYVFDDKLDPAYRELGGFFPIDGRLLGNSDGTPDHNFHFTFELHARFQYDQAAGQTFRFIGDDDVYVFIDGALVIDMGGVHSTVDQHVDLDRLGLEHGQIYTLDFFHAERHSPQSSFRIETNIPLGTATDPIVTAATD